MRAKKSFSLKTVVLLLAVAMVFGGAVGGTLAWLSDTSDQIVNTFTAGDVEITLAESDSRDGDNDPLTNSYKMVPGAKIAKDPNVTVLSGSENCWLFVKIEAENRAGDFLEYNVNPDWTPISTGSNVYYYNQNNGIVSTSTSNQTFYILTKGETGTDYANGYVTVKSDVGRDALQGIEEGKEPQLKITAYAIQSDNLAKDDGSTVNNAADAWAILNPGN